MRRIRIYNGSAWGPTTVSDGLNGVVAIAARQYHSLALIAEANQNIAPAVIVQASGGNILHFVVVAAFRARLRLAIHNEPCGLQFVGE